MDPRAEEIIGAAVKLEQDGYKFYRSVASKSTNRSIQKIFELLAEDELYHIDWLKVMNGDFLPVEINQKLYAQVKDIFINGPDDIRKRMLESKSDIDAVKQAIEIEDKTAAAYAKWAKDIDDGDLKELCNKLVSVERFHRQLLENMIAYLQESEDWFQFDGGDQGSQPY